MQPRQTSVTGNGFVAENRNEIMIIITLLPHVN